METKTHILEINLISAQGLKYPSANLRRSLQTYAIVHVDPSFKLRTLTRPGDNPTWNEKFLFRVKPEFLFSETSAVSVSIYATGYFSDQLIGTVRLLVGTLIPLSSSIGTPAFSAVQIRRPSGRFHGVLNVAATIADGLEISALKEAPAVCLRDLSEESCRRRRRKKGSESDCDYSDGTESTASSSSSSAASMAAALAEVNRDLAGSGGLLCCLGMQRKVHLGPSDRILRVLASQGKEN